MDFLHAPAAGPLVELVIPEIISDACISLKVILQVARSAEKIL